MSTLLLAPGTLPPLWSSAQVPDKRPGEGLTTQPHPSVVSSPKNLLGDV